MPFVGVLVRFRANYTPKAGAVRLGLESLDEEAGMGDASPSDSSLWYFGMMKRVYRIEGWAGLYKGLMPSIIGGIIAAAVAAPIGAVTSQQWSPGFLKWVIDFVLATIPAMLLVPVRIIVNRAIVTPNKLAAFDARGALRVLLSPAERAQPLRLYLAPGVAFAYILEALVPPALIGILILIAGASLPLLVGCAVPVILFTTALVTPLQVIAVRLTLQRRGSETLDPDTIHEQPVYEENESVTQFRTEEAPYTSLLDCARKIVAEEGWGVLTRAWWVTVLTMLPLLVAPALALWFAGQKLDILKI
ncbi:mitochondrial carrier [Mycena polygramma]|nr:mitochondrial carrier [Mycena polygramma]